MFFIRSLIVCFTVVFANFSAFASPVVRVGGYESAFAYNNGIGGVLSNLANTSAFGASFTQVNSIGQFGTITQSYLDSIDIFWSGLPYGSMTTQQATLLTNWINAGGVVIVNNDRSYTNGFRQFDLLYANFGISQQNVTSPLSLISPTGSHDILTGPFGVVGQFQLVDAVKLTVSGSTTALAQWSDGFVAAAIADRQAGREGALIVLPDWELTGVCFQCNFGIGGIEGQELAKNAWAYAAEIATTQSNVPEPASLALLAIGLAGLGAARRKTQ